MILNAQYLSSLAGLSSIPALLGMAAATGNDPVNGWRWIFRTQLVLSAIVFIGFALIYRVRHLFPVDGRVRTDCESRTL
jgi:hypothetical protein